MLVSCYIKMRIQPFSYIKYSAADTPGCTWRAANDFNYLLKDWKKPQESHIYMKTLLFNQLPVGVWSVPSKDLKYLKKNG